MKSLCILYTVLTVVGCSGSQSEQSTNQELATTDMPPMSQDYQILHVDDHQTFKNFDILIDSNRVTAKDLIIIGGMFKVQECQDVPCSNVTMWTTKSAMDLWYAKQDNPKWRRKNWPYLCEHDAAQYNVAVSKLTIFPFLDWEYKRWGGKKQRPQPHSIEMP